MKTSSFLFRDRVMTLEIWKVIKIPSSLEIPSDHILRFHTRQYSRQLMTCLWRRVALFWVWLCNPDPYKWRKMDWWLGCAQTSWLQRCLCCIFHHWDPLSPQQITFVEHMALGPAFQGNLISCECTVLTVNKIYTDWHVVGAAVKAFCAQEMHFALKKRRIGLVHTHYQL